MSSTNRGSVRELDDHYATDPALARLICEHLRDHWFGRQGFPQPRVVMEPGCGEGAFLSGARAAWPGAVAFGVEVQEQLAAEARDRGHLVFRRDFVAAGPAAAATVDLVVTNPPFVLATQFVLRSLQYLRPGGHAAFLLRTNFAGGSRERWEHFWPHVGPYWHHEYRLPIRSSFTPDGRKDSVEYSVFVFGTTVASQTTTSFLDNSKLPSRKQRKQEKG